MATNFVQKGDIIEYAHGSAVLSGAAVNIGQMVGIAQGDYGENELGAYAVEGVFEVPKAGATGALLPGALAYFAGGEVFAAAASGRVLGGKVVAGASASADTCLVKLTP